MEITVFRWNSDRAFTQWVHAVIVYACYGHRFSSQRINPEICNVGIVNFSRGFKCILLVKQIWNLDLNRWNGIVSDIN